MEPKRPKWSPGEPNGAQESQMKPRRPKWSTRDSLSTQNVSSSTKKIGVSIFG